MKRNKSLIFLGSICLGLMIAALPFMTACGGEAPAGPIKLVYATHVNGPIEGQELATDQMALVHWAEQVEQKTEGRVTVNIQWGAVLGPPQDILKMVGGVGVADAGMIVGPYAMWDVPLYAGTMMPFLTTGVETQMRATWKLYNEWAPMQEEFKKFNVRPLYLFAIDPYKLLIKQEITSLDDLKGKKIWAPGMWAEVVKPFGITPVFFPMADCYDAGQKGTIDGMCMTYGPLRLWKLHEPFPVFVDLAFAGGQAPCMQVINIDVWNRISSKDQKAIEEVNAGMMDFFIDYFHENIAYSDNFFKGEGMTQLALSPQEEAKTRDRCAEVVWSSWVAQAAEKGVPGEEFLQRYKAMVQEFAK